MKMYTLKINDDNTVTTTVKEKIIERSNCVDQIQILVAKLYKDQIDMSNAKVYMKYVFPISKKIKTIRLVANDTSYEDNYIQYLVPAESELTSEAGDVEISFNFIISNSNDVDQNNADGDNDDNNKDAYIRKTQSGHIQISPLAIFDKYETYESVTVTDEGVPNSITLDSENNKIVLVNKYGDELGDGISIESLSEFLGSTTKLISGV